MRILIINWRDIEHPWAGGGEVNIHEQAKRWVAWGHQVTMLCGGFPGRKPGTPRDTVIDGVRIIRRGGRFSVYPRAALYYLRHLRGQFDVVVDVANGIPMLTPLYTRLPKVVLFHHIHLRQWFVELRWPMAAIGWFLERFVVRLIYAGVPAVAISESTRRGLGRVGIDASRVQVVHPGLDHARYWRDGIEPDPRRLVYLGRLRQYKRLDELLRVVRDLSPEFPELGLDVIGVGEELEPLRKLARRWGIAERVTFHGFVPHERKVDVLQGAWAFVMPSLNEGWGISILEGNACGVPAVAFDVPGLNESIVHGQTGLLAASYDELREHTRRVLTDEALRRRLAEGALEWSARFDWDGTARQMLAALAALCPELQPAELPAPAPR